MAGRPLGMKSLMNALSKYTHAQLKKLISSVPTQDALLSKLERRREKLAQALARLDRRIAKLTGGGSSAPSFVRRLRRKPGRRKGYTLSAATRRKMSEAAKRRYAGKSAPGSPASAPEKKRRAMSPETRAKMAAAAKARWAKMKAAPVQA